LYYEIIIQLFVLPLITAAVPTTIVVMCGRVNNNTPAPSKYLRMSDSVSSNDQQIKHTPVI